MAEQEVFGFEVALGYLKEGKRVTRNYWKNAKFVFLVKGSKFQVNRAPLNEFFHEGTEVEYRPHIDLVAADGTVGVCSISNADILAEDWVLFVDAGSANPEPQEESHLPSADEDETPDDQDEDLPEPQ